MDSVSTIKDRTLSAERLSGRRQILADLFLNRLSGFTGQLRKAVSHNMDWINADWPFIQMKNGLVKISSLYFVVARNIENGEINIFWVPSPEYAEVNDDGSFKKQERRYHVATLNADTTKIKIRRRIIDEYIKIREFVTHRMSVHGGDVTDIVSTIVPTEHWKNRDPSINGYRHKTYAFGNDDFTVAVQEIPQKDGNTKWSVALYSGIYPLDGKPCYAPIDSIPPDMKWLKRIFSSGTFVHEFDTKGEALASMEALINERLQMTWDGLCATPISQDIITFGTTRGWNFGARLLSPDNIKDAGLNAGSKAATSVAAGVTLSLPFFVLSLTVAAARTFAIKAFVDTGKIITKEVMWQWKGIKSVFPERSDYVLDTRKNAKREHNTKPDPKMDEKIRVLEGDTADLTYDPVAQISSHERQRKEKELLNYAQNILSKRFAEIDSNTSSTFTYDGLIALVRRDPDTKALIAYFKYAENLAINDEIEIDPAIKDLLEGKDILRLEHQQNTKSISSTDISFETMQQEVSSKLFPNLDNVQSYAKDAVNESLDWMFNKLAEGGCDEGFMQPFHARRMAYIGSPQWSKAQKRLQNAGIEDTNAVLNPEPHLSACYQHAVFPYVSAFVRDWSLSPS